MKYQINKRNYRDFQTIHENRLAHRSYFIPFSTAGSMNASSVMNERSKSDAVLLLSGQWEFAYFKNASRLKKEIDTEQMSFDKVPVPSTWQKTGYDQINYLNSMYPFPCRPPKTPKNCPVGVYRKSFEMKKKPESTYFITFLGVSSSLDLYVNGRYVGYGEGSHNSREFDLTPFLTDGLNEIAAVVYKWSTGTYLECQDMFRENGIFRDVYITEMPKSYIFDFRFTTEKTDDGYNAALKAEICGASGAELKGELFLHGVSIACAKGDGNGEFKWDNLSVKEWSAETPLCYDLVLSLIVQGEAVQWVRQKVGFCNIVLDGFRYLFNGKAIKLKGVNHHDTHPVRGYAMTAEDLKKDVELMKEYNVNCLRTSHYPPDPLLITLCSMYGIYVVDEADIETHGCFIRNNSDLISDDPKWEKHYIDRVQALFNRDKNQPCIAMWSLGNESGGICNFDACNDYLKSQTTIPVHYEPACRSKRLRYDILAYFYTSPEEMRGLARHEWKDERSYDAPFFLCEYAHSMGVGPGGLDEYWDVIYSHDRFLGGCIWEWADHAHYDEKAKYKYTYGGDHKDRRNSGNFCCDGLFYPDRTPSSSALCMKNVYSPLRAEIKNNKLYVRNTDFFTSSAGTVISYYLLLNGEKCDEREYDGAIEPQCTAQLPVSFDFSECDDAFLILEYKNAQSGASVGREQKILNESFPKAQVLNKQLTWNESGGEMSVKGQSGAFLWDKQGRLSGITAKNKPIPVKAGGFTPMLYQGVIDNHVYTASSLKKAGLDSLSFKKYSGSLNKLTNIVISKFGVYSKGKRRFKTEILQKAVSENEMIVTFKLTSCMKKAVDMLQIGLTLCLDGVYNKVQYYGMGEEESYSDFLSQCVMGVYNTYTSKMYTENIKPQESGNRNMVRWATVTDEKGSGIRITALEQALNFKATDVNEDNLRKAKHMEDIVRQKETTLHINGFMRGIGSQSCGPDTNDKYKKILHYGETYSYSFKLEII